MNFKPGDKVVVIPEHRVLKSGRALDANKVYKVLLVKPEYFRDNRETGILLDKEPCYIRAWRFRKHSIIAISEEIEL